MSFVQDRALPIISFNTDITQKSNHFLVANQAKIETFLSKGTFCFPQRDFLLRGLSLGSVLFPRGLTTSAPCIFYSDHERWSPREFCCHLDPWAYLWKNCQKKKRAAKWEKEPVGHLCQDWRCKSCPNQKFLPPKKINSSPHLLKGCLDFLNFDSSTNNASALNSYYILVVVYMPPGHLPPPFLWHLPPLFFVASATPYFRTFATRTAATPNFFF